MICAICQSNKLRFFLSPYRGGQIYVCSNCTNAFTIPPPQVNYEENQFFQRAYEDQEAYRSYARPILKFIQEYKYKGRLLDVGTGGGYLIEEAGNMGFKAEGIEPSLGGVEFCHKRNLKVKRGFLEEKSYHANNFDIVVASHVIEHVKDPFAFLSICKKILKPNGYLYLSQTNYTGTISRILGSFWEGWVPQEHLVHFSPKGIRFFLEKVGFEVVIIKILPLGYAFSWKWGRLSILANNLYNSFNYIVSKLQIGFPFIGDQMYIFARVFKQIKGAYEEK